MIAEPVPPMLDLILLVDDDKVTNLLHKRQITRGGLARQIDVVTDGQAALEYLRLRAAEDAVLPDLVLLDINMPRMNGFEFLDAYEAESGCGAATPRIVMVSTSTLCHDRARAEASPLVAAYEVKPLGSADFERIVRDSQSRTPTVTG